MGEFREWEDYFYDAPHNGTLRNLWGIVDPDDLHVVESRIIADRLLELENGVVSIERTFDAEHVQAIHRHLAGDLYEWAGQFRVVGMTKQNPPHLWVDPDLPSYTHFAPPARIPQAVESIGRSVKEWEWASLSQDEVADDLARFHRTLNTAHPFREHNGRVTRVYMRHVAEYAGYRLVGPNDERGAHIAAVIAADRGNIEPLADLYRQRLRPATVEPQRLSERAERLLLYRSVSGYDRPNIAPSAQRYGPYQ